MSLNTPIPLWRNRNFQIFGAVSSLFGAWIAYDRWKDRKIRHTFEAVAREYGNKPGDVKRITLLLPRINHDKVDDEGENKRDELEGEFKIRCKKFVIPLLTLAGIDYHFFAHSNTPEVYRRWVKHFTTKEVVEPLEGFVQPQDDTFLKHGVVCTSDAMFDQTIILKEPRYNVYRVDVTPPEGMLNRWIRFFNHSDERQRIGQQVIELVESIDRQ